MPRDGPQLVGIRAEAQLGRRLIPCDLQPHPRHLGQNAEDYKLTEGFGLDVSVPGVCTAWAATWRLAGYRPELAAGEHLAPRESFQPGTGPGKTQNDKTVFEMCRESKAIRSPALPQHSH